MTVAADAKAPPCSQRGLSPEGAGPVFYARGLTKIYGGGGTEIRALDGVDLDIRSGEFVVLLGASGSGKSTNSSSKASCASPIR